MELSRLPKIKVNKVLSETFDDLESTITCHEIKPACKRHTVYKIFVQNKGKQGWFIARRYREFDKLKNDLKKLFPSKEFSFPPKRYFGDNFEPRFLNSRRQGLQGFLYMITRQQDVLKSSPVTEFLALNNPPTISDDVQQCKMVIMQLEEELTRLKQDNDQQNNSISSTNGQISDLNNQKQALLAALRHERQQRGKKQYPGDDLSLMFEYRSLPEVSRVDVSSFLVRKLVGGLTRKSEDKTRKDSVARNDSHRLYGKQRFTTREENGTTNRSRTNTPPPSEQMRELKSVELIRKGHPYIEIQSPRMTERQQFLSSDDVASPRSEDFKSFYELKQRRKSMPGAVEFHKVNHIMKSGNQVKMREPSSRAASLVVPTNECRPRSFSASPGNSEEILESGLKHAAVKRVINHMCLESPKRNHGWSSLKDLRKMKNKLDK